MFQDHHQKAFDLLYILHLVDSQINKSLLCKQPSLFYKKNEQQLTLDVYHWTAPLKGVDWGIRVCYIVYYIVYYLVYHIVHYIVYYI